MKRLFAASFGIFALTALACGTDETSEFFDSGADDDDAGEGSETTTIDPIEDDASASNDSGDEGDAACAADSVVAERAPAYLYFLLDQSGSMGDGTHGIAAEKWNPVTTALKGFLLDPKSKGISAALELFPKGADPMCPSTNYGKNLVAPLTALPDTANVIGSKMPAIPVELITPTLGALSGYLPAAQAAAKNNVDGKTVVIVVTDGDPIGCNDDSIASIETEVAKYKSTVPTYVLGVGTSTTNLNKIAAAGGTGSAILINVGTPSVTQAQLAKAIDDIRTKSLTCDVNIPAAPAGKTIDYAKINVGLSKSGTKTPLTYDPKCAKGGWKFDDEKAPKKIVLCPTLCTSLNADPSSAISVEFGCTRRVVIN